MLEKINTQVKRDKWRHICKLKRWSKKGKLIYWCKVIGRFNVLELRIETEQEIYTNLS